MALPALSPARSAGPMSSGPRNAWKVGDTSSAEYTCAAGHVIDPSETRQCPKCGVHDTVLLSDVDGRQEFRCAQCGELFAHPK